jgi:guanylate kinase
MSSEDQIKKGKLLIITAPSGAGKTTIVRHLLDKYDELAFSVSVTTRARREHEANGKDYYFISNEEFTNLIHDHAFAEWEEVYDGMFYGTLKTELERLWKQGKHIVFDIDVMGATTLKEKYPDKTLAVFIKPPSMEVLLERLERRKSETPENLKRRIRRAKIELAYQTSFDKILVNDKLDIALKEAEEIVEAFLAEK